MQWRDRQNLISITWSLRNNSHKDQVSLSSQHALREAVSTATSVSRRQMEHQGSTCSSQHHPDRQLWGEGQLMGQAHCQKHNQHRAEHSYYRQKLKKINKPFHSFLMQCKSLPFTQPHSAHSAHSLVFGSPRDNSTCKEVWAKKENTTQSETTPPQKAFKDNDMRETATIWQLKRWPYSIQVSNGL